MWEGNRATTSTANLTYSYTIGTATPTVTPTVVTETQLNDEGGTITSTSLYDALLRPRQTQYPTPQGGILVTDDFYDSRGWVWKINHNWWDTADSPSGNIRPEADTLVPDQTVTAFDALGRAVEVTSYDDSAVRSVAYTDYTGDKVITVPAATGTSPVTPVGATPTATVTDAIGRTTAQDSYTGWPAVTAGTNAGGFPAVTVTGGTSQATSYSYNARGLPATITAGGEQWSKTYNLLGQVSAAASPNAGTTGMSYDADGNLTQTTDANQNTITWTYDPLGRNTGEYDGTSSAAAPIATWAYDNSNNAVASMTDPIGQLTTQTSYDQNGEAFTDQQSGFNVFGESLGETVTVPADQGALAGSYSYSRGYSATTGLPLAVAYPASPVSGGTSALPAETVSTGYSTGFDLPATISTNAGGYRAGYVANVTYTAWTQAGQEELGTSAVNAFITNTFDPNTGQLTDTQVTNTAATTTYDDTAYAYDPSGNITAETDTRTTAAAGTQAEQQCFGYSPLDQLTQAWTTAKGTTCPAGPSTGSGGTVADGIPGAAYWTQWQYNPLGDQATETGHSLTGGASTLTSYTYNNGDGTSAGQPNTLTSSASTGGTAGTSAWTYDPDGNTTSASVTAGGTTQDECYGYTPGSQLSQAWPASSLPCPATPPAGSTTGYVYDASGNLLAADNPGSNTLYLPGEQITATTTGVTGTRFIALPGGGQVVRTGATTSYDYETADQHGTSLLVLDRTLQNPAWRQYTPYGAPRGTGVTWPDTNGYLGDPVNAADDLTTIGARQYNPATGRFLTPDPVFEAGDPTQMGGYAYAGDNPVSQSDPTGLGVPGGSICTGSVDCNGTGHQAPIGWSGPGYPTWTTTGSTGGSGRTYPVESPSIANWTNWINAMTQTPDLGTGTNITPIGARPGTGRHLRPDRARPGTRETPRPDRARPRHSHSEKPNR